MCGRVRNLQSQANVYAMCNTIQRHAICVLKNIFKRVDTQTNFILPHLLTANHLGQPEMTVFTLSLLQHNLFPNYTLQYLPITFSIT